MVAASAALALSGVPFMGPIGAARVGYINGELRAQPDHSTQMKEAELDLVVAGTADAVLMVESEAQELSEDVMLGAVMFGHRGMQPVIDAIIELAETRRQGAARLRSRPTSREIETAMLGIAEADLAAAYKITVKQERYAAVDAVKAKVMAALLPGGSRAALRQGEGRRRLQGAAGRRSSAGTSSTPASASTAAT